VLFAFSQQACSENRHDTNTWRSYS